MRYIMKIISLVCIFSALIFVLGTISWIEDAHNNDDVRWMVYSFLWWLKLHMKYTVPLLLVAWLSNTVTSIIKQIEEIE